MVSVGNPFKHITKVPCGSEQTPLRTMHQFKRGLRGEEPVRGSRNRESLLPLTTRFLWSSPSEPVQVKKL
jgi:hypothetical protein